MNPMEKITDALIASHVEATGKLSMDDINLIRSTAAAAIKMYLRYKPEASKPTTKQQPAVPIDQSITSTHLICLEDGKHLRMLKRHLRQKFGLTPDEYREKWGLPHDYPMISKAMKATYLRQAPAKIRAMKKASAALRRA